MKGTSNRRSWVVLGIWAALVAGLALLGSGLTARLAPTSLLVPGTPSANAKAMLDREFGNSVPVTVLLEGPSGELERQGKSLATALRREPGVQVMSPWGAPGGTLSVLRPRPGAALLVANFQRPESAAMSEVVPTANRIVNEQVHGPVRSYVGGFAAIAAALQENALAATHQAELLAAPILVIVLLLVFRTPVAAAIPLLMGAATVASGRGLLLLSTYQMPVNALAAAIASMMGLALGVDYALLMVSRFRQERDRGVEPEAAIATAAAAAGRTIVFAGVTLALVMVTAATVAPGDLLGSVAAGVVVSTLLSVALAISLLPALLRVLAPYLERWRLPSFGRGGRLLRIASAAVERPWIAIPLIIAPMLAIAAPAGALRIGPPDPHQLPSSDPTRQGFEELRKVIGPGWAAPYAIVATADKGPISSPGRLESIARWQDQIARDPDVATVIGPAPLAKTDQSLNKARAAYRSAPARLDRAQRDLASLRGGLRQASGAVKQLRQGLGDGADGATTIAAGTRRAQSGAKQLDAGVRQAHSGAGQLATGLDKTQRGAAQLVQGQHKLTQGAQQVADGLRQLDDTLSASLAEVEQVSNQMRDASTWLRSLSGPTQAAAEQLDAAMQQLNGMTLGRNDPRYPALRQAILDAAAIVGVPLPPQLGGPPPDQPAGTPQPDLPPGVSQSIATALVGFEQQLANSLDSLQALPQQIEQLAAAVHQLRDGSAQVAAGARATERGGRSLLQAIGRLDRGAHRLERGLADASDGSSQLVNGLGDLAAGNDRLASGLRSGQARSGALLTGLQRPQGPLSRYALALHGYGRQLQSLRSQSPGAIDSGYLMLTALDGTVPGMRQQVEQLVNLDDGGRAVRMLVIPKSDPSADATVQLGKRLRTALPKLAKASNTSVAIGEGAQTLADYSGATMARIPWLVLALCLVSILALIAVLRSLLLPVVAIALNLLTIAAAFGALQLFFGLNLLVGPRYIDAISAAGVLTIMFALSIDYEVFLLTRMREAWLQTSDHTFAITHGLGRTAGVITGAATIMSFVFLAFATSDIASLQQFGAGLTFAVVLDATVVRLILLPAVMRAIGRRAWWLPAWLDRVIPQIEHVDEDAGAEAAPGDRSAPADLAAASAAEHSRLLELLDELESASAHGEADRVVALAREWRAAAERHFHFEQDALFPRLSGQLGEERIEALQAAQAGAARGLARVEELSQRARWRADAMAETRELLHSARASVRSCAALDEMLASQPAGVAEQVLAARQRAQEKVASPFVIFSTDTVKNRIERVP